MSCPFCTIPISRIIAGNELAFAIRDGFPVTELHTLVIPKRHIADWFGLTAEELLACYVLIKSERERIVAADYK
ncbi:MAG: HIT family protein [Acidobacteria bacterium]|nr:HIT family protein [Acidobacteriota bacterium]